VTVTIAQPNIGKSNLAEPHDGAFDTTRRYVLSAGRTGTVFMENLIDDLVPGVTAMHEPTVTRYQMMLANLRNNWGVGRSALATWFRRSRHVRELAMRGTYVELNPFLCAMSDLLPEQGRQMRVVHMVRHPADWARSITTFKSSHTFRAVIDYVPFAKPYPAPRPQGWQALSDYEKALWRWNWCNERILAVRDHCEAYTVVRYEDLFHGSPDQRQRAIGAIFQTLDLGPEPLINDLDLGKRVNTAPPTNTVVDPDNSLAFDICGTLGRQFGYND
jgi:hypothetical protein